MIDTAFSLWRVTDISRPLPKRGSSPRSVFTSKPAARHKAEFFFRSDYCTCTKLRSRSRYTERTHRSARHGGYFIWSSPIPSAVGPRIRGLPPVMSVYSTSYFTHPPQWATHTQKRAGITLPDLPSSAMPALGVTTTATPPPCAAMFVSNARLAEERYTTAPTVHRTPREMK